MPEHLDRTVAAMSAADLDALLLGRQANTRYVTGANQLWLAGTRPFAPGCVVIRDTKAVHVLSVTDDGLPPIVAREHLYPITWNPMNLVGGVAAIPEVAAARLIGVDGMTPMFEQLIHGLLPNAELVDAEAVLRDIRRVKTDDDIAGVRAAAQVARDALEAAFTAFAPGTSPNELKAVFTERMCSDDVTTPAFEAQFTIDGETVSARAGVIRNGWEASLARTRPEGLLTPRTAEGIAACVPGISVGEVRAAHFTVDGVGIGHEELFDDDTLEPGMVLYVEATQNAAVLGDTILVTDTTPEVLTHV
jgi:Xaa-Pro aminopeptidase